MPVLYASASGEMGSSTEGMDGCRWRLYRCCVERWLLLLLRLLLLLLLRLLRL
jgi:hypothetical protein